VPLLGRVVLPGTAVPGTEVPGILLCFFFFFLAPGVSVGLGEGLLIVGSVGVVPLGVVPVGSVVPLGVVPVGSVVPLPGMEVPGVMVPLPGMEVPGVMVPLPGVVPVGSVGVPVCPVRVPASGLSVDKGLDVLIGAGVVDV
jgi:hypothetical protein